MSPTNEPTNAQWEEIGLAKATRTGRPRPGERRGRRLRGGKGEKATVLMQRLSYATETVLSNKITRNRIVLLFKDSPRKPFGRRPRVAKVRVTYEERGQEGSAFPEAARKGVFHLGRPQTFQIFLPLPTCPQIHATSLTKVAYYVCF